METIEELQSKISNLETELAGLENERDTLLNIVDAADELRKKYSQENKEAYDEARAELEDYDNES